MRAKSEINILIVDDEVDLREILSMNLEMEGYKVFQAANGKEGLEQIKNNAIDFVISDVRMPGGDGVFLLDSIKTLFPNIPVVVLISGFSDVGRSEAQKKGALDLLDKPVDISYIEKLIEAHIK